MEKTAKLQDFETILVSLTERFEWRDDVRLDVFLPSERLGEAVQLVLESGWKYLSAITGLDVAPLQEEGQEPREGAIEVLYHFIEKASVLTLRVHVPYIRAAIPTVCDQIPYATLYERELIEMLGVEITGTPSTDRLLLPDDWPDGVYPLRKSFKGL
jgi:Ni,Fe-hydrogenase III component G